MHLLSILAIAAAAPFVASLDPASDAPAASPPVASAPAASTPVTSAPATATPAAMPAPSTAPVAETPAHGSLSSLVAEAIKRKLDRAAATTGGTIALPGTPMLAPLDDQPSIDPARTVTFGPGGGAPDPSMMSSSARVMMGSPTDGSPSYSRVLTPQAGTPELGAAASPAATAAQGGAAPAANPFAPAAQPDSAFEVPPAAADPGMNHNLLDLFVGTWDVSANFDTGPGQPSETASGSMVNSWQLGGRWLKQDYTGQMASLGSFRGLGYIGYDNIARCFVATWMDTLSTACLTSKGSFDEASATFTLSGDFTAPGGEKFKQRQVITVLSLDRYTVTMFLTGPDHVEFKTGNLEYTRSIRTITNANASAK